MYIYIYILKCTIKPTHTHTHTINALMKILNLAAFPQSLHANKHASSAIYHHVWSINAISNTCKHINNNKATTMSCSV